MAPIVSRFSLKRVKRTYLYLGSILAPSPSVRWRLAGRSLPCRVAAVVQGFARQFPGFPLPLAPCVVACLTALTGLTANCTSPVPLCVPSERLGGVGVGVWVRVCVACGRGCVCGYAYACGVCMRVGCVDESRLNPRRNQCEY